MLNLPGAELQDGKQLVQGKRTDLGQVRIKEGANADYFLARSKRYPKSQMTRQSGHFTGLEIFHLSSGVYTLKWTSAGDAKIKPFARLTRSAIGLPGSTRQLTIHMDSRNSWIWRGAPALMLRCHQRLTCVYE